MTNEIKIIVIDDERIVLDFIKDCLKEYHVALFDNPLKAFEEMKNTPYDLVITDQIMPDMLGIELLMKAKKIHSDFIGIILSAYIDKSLLEDLINKGLIHYVMEKPVTADKVKEIVNISIKEILKKRKEKEKVINLEVNYQQSREELAQYKFFYHYQNVHIITRNKAMKELIAKTEKIAQSNANVLITGETGTGKDLFANLIHLKSRRNQKRFVKINCSSIPENLFESELFGYEKGAFTGAVKTKTGKFELSHEGTIFLDEIGEMPLTGQAKLLRVIEEGEINRLGGINPVKIDVRIISATNRNIPEMVKNNEFREDLFHRLNVLNLKIPSLRERKEDIPLLAAFYLEKISSLEGGPEKYFDHASLECLKNYKFPGNIRELKNLIHRLYISIPEEIITLEGENLNSNEDGDQLVTPIDSSLLNKTMSYNEIKNEFERKYLKRQLEIHHFNINQTAKALSMDPGNLHRKLKSLQIQPEKIK